MSEDHTVAYEIRAAISKHGCPICSLAERALKRYLSAFANEGVMDRRQREIIRAAYGFCAIHAHALRNSRDALGSAIVHRDLLANLARALEQEQPTARQGFRIRQKPGKPLPAHGGCIACERVREAEERYSVAFPLALQETETYQRFEQSAGLCVPHLRLVLRQATGPDHQKLKMAQAAIWQRLLAELDEFIRKQDHRFTHEKSGSEADSWRRAIDLIAGNPECAGEEHHKV